MLAADGNRDGVVNAIDHAIYRKNLGASLPAPATIAAPATTVERAISAEDQPDSEIPAPNSTAQIPTAALPVAKSPALASSDRAQVFDAVLAEAAEVDLPQLLTQEAAQPTDSASTETLEILADDRVNRESLAKGDQRWQDLEVFFDELDSSD